MRGGAYTIEWEKEKEKEEWLEKENPRCSSNKRAALHITQGIPPDLPNLDHLCPNNIG